MNFKFFLFVVFMVSISFGRIITDTVKTDYIRSNPDIDSTKGNTVHTGTYTVTGTATVDSLKSIKGINATRGHFDSLQLGSGSYLKTYLDTTFYDTLLDGGAYKSRALCRLVQIGNQVTLYQPQLSSTSFSTGSRVTGIPSKFLGSSNFSVTCFVYSNGTTEVGALEFNNTALGYPNNFIRTHSFGISFGSGTHGLYPCCLTWTIN